MMLIQVFFIGDIDGDENHEILSLVDTSQGCPDKKVYRYLNGIPIQCLFIHTNLYLGYGAR